MSISENYKKLLEQTGNNNVEIIAVTKYASVAQMKEAYELGLNNFAESYVQDALAKQKELSDLKIKWHFIGRLQKNKVKFVVGKYDLIHSVDSVKLAEVIDRKSNEEGIVQEILIQVNTGKDPSKAGFLEEELEQSFESLLKLQNIKIRGLMTIAPNIDERETLEKCFKGLKTLRDSLKQNYKMDMDELSMGMTGDYKVAIENGATMIRVGQGIFKN